MKPYAGFDTIANASSDESRARDRFIMVASSRADDAMPMCCLAFMAMAVSVFDQRKKRDGFQKRTIKENTVEESEDAAVAS